MLTSKVFLVLFENMKPLVDFSDRQLGPCTEGISIPLLHGFLIMINALYAARFWDLNDLKVRWHVFKLIFQSVGQHFIVNDNYHIDLELASSLCQAIY